jgi:hypothetical protein
MKREMEEKLEQKKKEKLLEREELEKKLKE